MSRSLLKRVKGRLRRRLSLAAWLKTLPKNGSYYKISEPRFYAHDETQYDTQYSVTDVDMELGLGLIKLVKEIGIETSGAALEVGCGTGVLSAGLVKSKSFSRLILTDPSPAFLSITEKKLKNASLDLAGISFAIFSADDIAQLPSNAYSMIVLRSVLHHILDVNAFIREAARVLRRGGALVFEEPCSEGYILMGAMAQFLPAVLKNETMITDEHRKQIQLFVDTMHFYARRDLDKSGAEDKHLFRVDELMTIGAQSGLAVNFYPNRTFESFIGKSPEQNVPTSFYDFFHAYVKHCMGFDPKLVMLIEKHFPQYCTFLDQLASDSNGPYMHGTFVCRKS